MKILILGLLIVVVSCNSNPNNSSVSENNEKSDITNDYKLNVEFVQELDSSVHYRGLFLMNSHFFVSGTKGSLVILSDSLEKDSLIAAKFTDLRDIHVLNDGSVIVMGIASPGKIWKRSSGDDAFKEVYSNDDSLVFMDGMDFWNDSIGLVYGDPINGKHFILKTVDGGETWKQIDVGVQPLENEAGFAASGTGIQCVGDGVAYVGMGGDEARVLKTTDYGQTWEVFSTPVLSGKGGKGIYSLAFEDELNGVIVGGYWQNHNSDSSKAYTNDGGVTWKLSSGVQEYRSCVTRIKNSVYLSTGTSGTDITYDGGKSWVKIDSVGFNAIKFINDTCGLAVGNFGKIAKVKLVK